jgi:FkbM family methyltransferase
MQYFSQYGQDHFLDKEVFKQRNYGIFVDIGAHDGLTYSNTAFFEKYRGWKGICIEPNPIVFNRLVNARPLSTNLNLCVGVKNTLVDFYKVEGYSEMLSGVKDNYDNKHLKRLEREINERGGGVELIKLKSMPLSLILKERGVSKVDYISIDVEGSEEEVLNSIDFKEVEIHAISIENNYSNASIHRIMDLKDYKLIRKLKCDEIYIKKRRKFFFLKF